MKPERRCFHGYVVPDLFIFIVIKTGRFKYVTQLIDLSWFCLYECLFEIF